MLKEAVIWNICSARAPSRCNCYSQKVDCIFRLVHTQKASLALTSCAENSIRSFLQSLVHAGRAHNTVNVDAPAISSFHQLDKDHLLPHFLKGTCRLRPGRRLRAPSLDPHSFGVWGPIQATGLKRLQVSQTENCSVNYLLYPSVSSVLGGWLTALVCHSGSTSLSFTRSWALWSWTRSVPLKVQLALSRDSTGSITG